MNKREIETRKKWKKANTADLVCIKSILAITKLHVCSISQACFSHKPPDSTVALFYS